MPKSATSPAHVLARLPAALEARMAELGHTQSQAASAAGVAQSDVSRALNGARKRMRPPLERLCRYANLDAGPGGAQNVADELSQLLRRVIGDNPAAAAPLRAVLHSLTPLLTEYHPGATSASAGLSHDPRPD